jgi:hypothetical protein
LTDEAEAVGVIHGQIKSTADELSKQKINAAETGIDYNQPTIEMNLKFHVRKSHEIFSRSARS